MSTDMLMGGGVFLAVTTVALLVGLLGSGRGNKLDSRIDALARGKAAEDRSETVSHLARTALPRMGKVIVPENEAERTRLRARLVHAGFYNAQTMHVFLGVKLSLLLAATIVGVGLTILKVIPLTQALVISMGLFMGGMIGPSFWLDNRKKARQSLIRRGLPDALDVLVICLEGGLSLQAALKRVSDELCGAHPVLGSELKIADREIQLGQPPGEALSHFAQRTDLEEVLSLASVVGQSERFGASLVKSLRTFADTLRHKRKQKAEEKAQKASTKILIPTLLLIFPAVFVILLAPAVFQVMNLFTKPPGK